MFGLYVTVNTTCHVTVNTTCQVTVNTTCLKATAIVSDNGIFQ